MPTSITGQGISVYPAPDDALSSTSKNPVQNKVIDEEFSDVNNQLSDKQDAPSTDGTAGQVLSLDDNLNPVWSTPSGGGGDVSNCAPIIINTASGNIASFADGADNRQIRKIVGTIVPVQSGTGDPSPDNVRPISGWTGAEIQQTGKNLLNKSELIDGYIQISDGSYISVAWFKCTDYLRCASGLTIHTKNTCDSASTIRGIGFYDKNKNFINGISQAEDNVNEKTYSVPSNAVYFRISIAPSVADSAVVGFYTIEGYTQYHATTLLINWQTEAGTIYGGTVTLNEDGSADVENDRLFVVLDGSSDEDWDTGNYGASVKWTVPDTIYNKIVNPASSAQPYDAIANYLRPIAQSANWNTHDNFFAHTIRVIFMKCSTIGDFANWRDYLSENPLTILFKLRNPETYHFDNIGELYTYFGTNNVWIDTGAITECDYPADTKLYLTARDEEITGNIAPIENGTTSSKAYAQGAYFWHDTKFCKALTAIASGATFTLGTNYQETTVAAELLAAQN